MTMRKLFLLSFLVAALAGIAPAGIQTHGFDCITNNAAASCAIGEAQIFMDVIWNPDAEPGLGPQPVGASQILFVFRNLGPSASSIADIYFDSVTGLLLNPVIINSAGVQFSLGASPPNLPGGQSIDFNADLAADSDAPTAVNGVNPGEKLGVLFSIVPGQDVLAALANGALKVGVHVQAFANGKSEGLVNVPPDDPGPPVPEPGSFAALALGMFGVGYAIRRRRLS